MENPTPEPEVTIKPVPNYNVLPKITVTHQNAFNHGWGFGVEAHTPYHESTFHITREMAERFVFALSRMLNDFPATNGFVVDADSVRELLPHEVGE